MFILSHGLLARLKDSFTTSPGLIQHGGCHELKPRLLGSAETVVAANNLPPGLWWQASPRGEGSEPLGTTSFSVHLY